MSSKIDRRTKSRVDLQLSCRVDGRSLISEKSGTTENISRNGLLLRWTRSGPLPTIGSVLRVEVELPSEGLVAPRLIRCESTVVRVLAGDDGHPQVGLHVHTMRFIDDAIQMWHTDLSAATPVSERVN